MTSFGPNDAVMWLDKTPAERFDAIAQENKSAVHESVVALVQERTGQALDQLLSFVHHHICVTLKV